METKKIMRVLSYHEEEKGSDCRAMRVSEKENEKGTTH